METTENNNLKSSWNEAQKYHQYILHLFTEVNQWRDAWAGRRGVDKYEQALKKLMYALFSKTTPIETKKFLFMFGRAHRKKEVLENLEIELTKFIQGRGMFGEDRPDGIEREIDIVSRFKGSG